MTALWAVLTGLFASGDAVGPIGLPLKDFVEYWSAARVHVRGGNPYDGDELFPVQRQATGNPDLAQPTMLWTPPWTLPVYLPFGALPLQTAHLAWLAVQVGCVLLSSWLLWRVYGGPTGQSRLTRALWATVPVLIAVAFAPPWWLVWYGQNGAFLLLGVTGFLYLRQRGYPVAAGAVAALTAIKPHLLALFGLALLLDATTRPGRRVLVGGIGAVLVASAVALIPDPDVFGQYAAAVSRPTTATSTAVADWQLPLLSYRLRWAINPDRFWIQFVPILAAGAVLLPYWWLRRKRWDWPTEAPRLVLASVILAPYGWIFDWTVLLVPVMYAFARAVRDGRLVPVGVAVAGHLAASLFTPTIHGLHDAIWYPYAVLVWYAAVVAVSRPAVSPPAGAGA